jgi:hypothetical protein
VRSVRSRIYSFRIRTNRCSGTPPRLGKVGPYLDFATAHPTGGGRRFPPEQTETRSRLNPVAPASAAVGAKVLIVYLRAAAPATGFATAASA